MKTKRSILFAGVFFISLFIFVPGCAQKVNNPADVQAIKNSIDDYVKAMNAGDADAAVVMMSENVVYAGLNAPAQVGKEAVQKMHKALFELVRYEFSAPVDAVHVSGDLGAARGTWTAKVTPVLEQLIGFTERGSWTAISQRQSDGTWKWESVIPNSDQPLPGTTADGVEEAALLQIEQDWLDSFLKSDWAKIDQLLATEWTHNADGQVTGKKQALAEFKRGDYKFESLKMSDFSTHVLGDAAVVASTVDVKGKYKGTEISGKQRSYDFFVKRDGRWQAISTQNTTIK